MQVQFPAFVPSKRPTAHDQIPLNLDVRFSESSVPCLLPLKSVALTKCKFNSETVFEETSIQSESPEKVKQPQLVRKVITAPSFFEPIELSQRANYINDFRSKFSIGVTFKNYKLAQPPQLAPINYQQAAVLFSAYLSSIFPLESQQEGLQMQPLSAQVWPYIMSRVSLNHVILSSYSDYRCYSYVIPMLYEIASKPPTNDPILLIIVPAQSQCVKMKSIIDPLASKIGNIGVVCVAESGSIDAQLRPVTDKFIKSQIVIGSPKVLQALVDRYPSVFSSLAMITCDFTDWFIRNAQFGDIRNLHASILQNEKLKTNPPHTIMVADSEFSTDTTFEPTLKQMFSISDPYYVDLPHIQYQQQIKPQEQQPQGLWKLLQVVDKYQSILHLLQSPLVPPTKLIIFCSLAEGAIRVHRELRMNAEIGRKWDKGKIQLVSGKSTSSDKKRIIRTMGQGKIDVLVTTIQYGIENSFTAPIGVVFDIPSDVTRQMAQVLKLCERMFIFFNSPSDDIRKKDLQRLFQGNNLPFNLPPYP
ncbi:hypothetical protein RCL1_004694 [Eukaryota sp. TZLM3-RCL]